jgi:translation initiation factor eIF-2B subunit epsilon
MMESEAFVAYTEGSFTFADIPSVPAESDNAVVFGRQKGVDVVKELKEICMDFDDNGNTPMENLAIELNSYKFSQNATYSDCTMAATLTVLERLGISAEMSDGKLVSGLKNKLAFWGPLLKKLSIGQAEELAIIHAIERAATSQNGDELTGMAIKLSSGLSFRFLLQTLHDEEVLSEQALLAWAEQRKSEPDSSPLGKLFRLQSVQDFLEWLEEGDEDDDDDDDDDEDDEDDD